MKITKYDKQAIVKAMNPTVRKVFKEFPKALREYHVGDLTYDGSWNSRNVVVGDVTDEMLKTIFQPYFDQDDNLYAAHNKLRNAIDSCNTRKALMDRLPEFEKYFPIEVEPTKNLPALENVVSDLSKLGWPKKKGTV